MVFYIIRHNELAAKYGLQWKKGLYLRKYNITIAFKSLLLRRSSLVETKHSSPVITSVLQ